MQIVLPEPVKRVFITPKVINSKTHKRETCVPPPWVERGGGVTVWVGHQLLSLGRSFKRLHTD